MANPAKQPITGPHVWLGKDYADRDGWMFHLNQAHLAEIDAAVHRIPTAIPALYDVTAKDFPLPLLASELRKLDDELQHGRGFVLLRGLPADRYSEQELGAIFWGIGAHFGVGLAQSRKRDRLGHVIDLSGLDSDIRQMRSYEIGGTLRMHTDLNNDVVGLLMFRHAKRGGESRIASSLAVHNIILAEHPEYLEPLYRGYYFHVQRGDRIDDKQLTGHRIPIFVEHARRSWCTRRTGSTG